MVINPGLKKICIFHITFSRIVECEIKNFNKKLNNMNKNIIQPNIHNIF